MSVSVLVPRMGMREMSGRPDADSLLNMWIYMNLISNTILLPILVATFIFSKRAKRHPTLINVCVTWILSGFYSLFLFYGGVPRMSDPPPSRALCVAQASTMYGITPMWSVAILVLMYHLVAVTRGRPEAWKGKAKMILMIGSPYIVAFAFTLAALVISLTHDPKLVDRRFGAFFCGLNFKPLFNAMSIFTFIMCLGINTLEIQLAMILYRNWQGLRQAGHHYNVEIQLLIRVFVFGIYIFFGMGANIVSMFDYHTVAPYVYAATVGTVILLVFGSQPDVLRVWCFWRKDPSPPSVSSATPSSTRERDNRSGSNNHQSRPGSTLGLDPSHALVTFPSTVHGYNRVRGPGHMNGYQRV
ncbi:hypothetical protein K435DRAFT_750751 [Dendrothele bispora CBS 962.96]|uniref:G-protein coupled receptors family 1 profile domain-containing protein n=1 Tax=Dendrothele bispora (strain CBS 962.96) TaxID=1314807 RepID=A0A4S8MDZ6_DENBC|nr:hypothetical protein K435DRAFT_750751 [Dendrothele bispora CBS 962.96]